MNEEYDNDSYALINLLNTTTFNHESIENDNINSVEIKYDTYLRYNHKDNSVSDTFTTLNLALVKKHHSLWAEYIYNAARVLADMIDNNEINCQNKKILELGAGAGLPSIIASLNDAKEIIITDYGFEQDKSLIIAIEMNISYIQPFLSDDVNIIGLDYIWGNSLDRIIKPNESFSSNLFDIIICADLLFNRSEHHKLLWTIKNSLDEKGTAYISFSHHDPSKKEKDLNFFNLAKEYGLITKKLNEIKKVSYPFTENDGLDNDRGYVYIYTLQHLICSAAQEKIKKDVDIKCFKSILYTVTMRKWAIVETYYKYAEYELIICNSDDELEEYLLSKLKDDYRHPMDINATYELDYLINLAQSVGNEQVKSQRGWGIREIREIE